MKREKGDRIEEKEEGGNRGIERLNRVKVTLSRVNKKNYAKKRELYGSKIEEAIKFVDKEFDWKKILEKNNN
ncbi:MAG: hypothetical protein ACFFA7_06530 [Promethearchaeota archaeon]